MTHIPIKYMDPKKNGMGPKKNGMDPNVSKNGQIQVHRSQGRIMDPIAVTRILRHVTHIPIQGAHF
jgi:hypothetical protein